MIFWLKSESGLLDLNGVVAKPFISAVENLGEAGFRGKHLILGPRRTFESLARCADLSAKAKAYYLRMSQNLTQIGGVMNSFPHVSVSAEAIGISKLGEEWVVPLALFSDEQNLESAKLVAEDLSDVDVIESLLKIYVRDQCGGISINLMGVNGGGGSTGRALSRQLDDAKSIVFCLVDSDRKHLGGALGNTARGCKDSFSRHMDRWNAMLLVIEARELENLLPHPARVELAARLDEGRRAAAEQFAYVDSRIADYCCLKSGENICRFALLDRDVSSYPAIREALDQTRRHHPMVSRCGAGDNCADEGCSVVPKLGDRALEGFVNLLQRSDFHRAVRNPDDWHPELQKIVHEAVLFFAAAPRMS